MENNETYEKQLANIADRITESNVIRSVYHAFCDVFEGNDHRTLLTIRNALLSDFYSQIRCLLDQNDESDSLTKLWRVVKKCDQDDFEKECLPNSYNQWKKLKTYINKNIAHKDRKRKNLLNGFSWNEIDLIQQEIENTFNNFVRPKNYSFNTEEVEKYSKDLFEKMKAAIQKEQNLS